MAEKIQKNLWLTPEQRDKLDGAVAELNTRLKRKTGVSEIAALALDDLLRRPISEIRGILLAWRESEPEVNPTPANESSAAELGRSIVDQSVADIAKASQRARRRAHEG